MFRCLWKETFSESFFKNTHYPGGVDGDGELHQCPGPDDQHNHAKDLVGVDFVILGFIFLSKVSFPSFVSHLK